MNNRQRFLTYTNEEKFEFISLGYQIRAQRHKRIIFTGVRLVRNRRLGYQAHFLHDRRDGRHDIVRRISLVTFGVVLVSVSLATWSFALATWNAYGAIAIFFHVTALWGVLAFKPYNRMKPA